MRDDRLERIRDRLPDTWRMGIEQDRDDDHDEGQTMLDDLPPDAA